MSTTEHNGKTSPFLAPEVDNLLASIAVGMDLLEAAGGLVMLREIIDPESLEYEHATQELAKFLCLARVSAAEALSIVEAEDES